MPFDKKQIVRTVVGDILSESYPEACGEFESTFDTIYEALCAGNAGGQPGRDQPSEDAIPFDSAVAGQAVVATVCFLALSLLKAAMKDFTRRDLPTVLDRMERKLSAATGRERLVKKVRQRLEGILQSL